MSRRKKKRLRLYIEAGLAVFLAAVLAFAGRTGAFSGAEGDQLPVSQADSAEEGESAESTEESADGQDESGVSEAEGQYPIMGKSDVTVQEMVDYFEESGEKYPSEELSEGGADTIETFCHPRIPVSEGLMLHRLSGAESEPLSPCAHPDKNFPERRLP